MKSTTLRIGTLVLGCILASAASGVALASSTDVQVRLADKAPALPVTSTFEKATSDGVNGYSLNLKNVSNDSLKLTVTITPSVTFHADAKVKTLPAHALDAGQTWTIDSLVAGDKLSIAAAGFSTLELTVP